jgi:hypothetical protein
MDLYKSLNEEIGKIFLELRSWFSQKIHYVVAIYYYSHL